MVRIGIIGTGLIATEHAKAISMIPGSAALVAATDVVPEKLRDFCSAAQVARTYDSAEDLMADPDVDLVSITTPPASHEELVVAALEHGKYVFCEKPLAHSLASGIRIAEAAARHPGRLAVSFQLRYDASFRRLLWLCQNGSIGKVQSALIERHGYIPHTDHGDKGWWGSWKIAGGGVLLTQLVHELDLLLLAMGRPLSVSAEMDTRFTAIESEDYVHAILRFPGGRTARCIASVNSGHLGGGFAIKGSAGTVSLPWNLSIDDPRLLSKALREVDKALPETRASSSSILARSTRFLARRLGSPQRPALTPHAHLYQAIANSIENAAPLPIPPAEALGSLELCMSMYESAITGKEIELPLSVTSSVYHGVSKEAYEARKCSKGSIGVVQGDFVSLPVHRISEPKIGMLGLVKGLAREVLGMANIQPGTIRALLRKPAPVHGGPRARRWPWPERRHFDKRERQAVLRLMNREIRFGGAVEYGGAEEQAYCNAFARYLGGGYADAVNSGTNAVYLALRALDLKPGSEVIVPPITDPGGMMPVAMNMCIPVPADAEPGSVLTSVDQIRAVLSERTSAIVVAHIAGHPVDMDPIMELAAGRRIPVVEDCAQAHGALYKGRMVGTLGTIAAFSTMFGKHHATGGQGGVVFTRDPFLFARAKQFADRGKAYDGRGFQANRAASLNFNQDEISMAIGRVQLEKLPGFVKARRTFVALVNAGLKGVDGVSLIGDPPNCESSYLFLMIRIETSKFRCNVQEFASAVCEEGIDRVTAGYAAYPTDQPWHRNAAAFGTSGLPWSLAQGTKPRYYELPNARRANQAIVCVDVHELLGVAEARDLVTAIEKVARYYQVS